MAQDPVPPTASREIALETPLPRPAPPVPPGKTNLYLASIERSLLAATDWAVFEPNDEALWQRIRTTIETCLLNEWQSRTLFGTRPEEAYFVRCDRTTMTQDDLDNGRLVCVVGVAPVRPAEFVVFRIGQWTADRKC